MLVQHIAEPYIHCTRPRGQRSAPMLAVNTIGTPGLWIGFILFVLVMLALDLGVFHRKAHAIGFKEAAGWSAVWVSLSLIFNGFVWWRFGSQAGLEFLTGYLIEKSLSVDNIFVFVVIFSSLSIPLIHQHRVLFWGIITALMLRAAMIFAGAALLARFHWVMYAFGAFLVLTGVRLFLSFRRKEEEHIEDSRAFRLIRRLLPSTTRIDGQHFFTLENGRRVATPLMVALLLVEVTDVVFALDSIPAIFAITRDPFIVFTSNIFAILGLRSLFFLLAGLVTKFAYLKVGLSAVLVFIGMKMVIVDLVKIPILVSLGVIAMLLGASVLVSFFRPPTAPGDEGRPDDESKGRPRKPLRKIHGST